MATAKGPGDEAAGRGGEQNGPPQHVELQIPMAGAMAVAAKVYVGCRWHRNGGVSTTDFVLLTFWYASALGWPRVEILGCGKAGEAQQEPSAVGGRAVSRSCCVGTMAQAAAERDATQLSGV